MDTSQPRADSRDDLNEDDGKDTSQRLEKLEREASDIIGVEEDKEESVDSDTYKNLDNEEIKDDHKKQITKTGSKIYTDSDLQRIRSRGDPTYDNISSDELLNMMNELEDQRENITVTQERIHALNRCVTQPKKYTFDVTFSDNLMKGVHPEKLIREDFKLYELEAVDVPPEEGVIPAGDENFLTYESSILLNFDMTNEDNNDVKHAQLSSRCYASDACYPLKVEDNQFAELSRFRIVPNLKYENHLRIIEALREGESEAKMSTLYDLFFQEGESNIEKQKELKGSPV